MSYPPTMVTLRSLLDVLTPASFVANGNSLANGATPPLQSSAGFRETEAEREARLRRERIARVGPFIPDIPSTANLPNISRTGQTGSFFSNNPNLANNQIDRSNPQSGQSSGFKFIDYLRDSFVQLPYGQSDFQQTNRALERSPSHRLLFHGLWRQPMTGETAASPIRVKGGQEFSPFHELDGSLKFFFNDARDRIVIEADLWLAEFSTVPLPDSSLELPLPPEARLYAAGIASVNPSRDPRMPPGFNSPGTASPNYSRDLPVSGEPDGGFGSPDSSFNGQRFYPVQIYPMQQRRELRSREFHYLDNPALGIVVTVTPYELPLPPSAGFESYRPPGLN